MRIRQLRLINVKSYRDETLEFQPGINFISGINGAGKSTIIESLGYALFNYNPYVLKQFLREGATQGEIQVLIEARDERFYRVIRKFTATASTKWEVWDEETSSMLQDLHGADDVQRWLKQTMGLGENQDLSDLFRQVIAVQQGQFTTPFLESASLRTQTFDAVLKVEDFRSAFGQTAFLERTFQQEATSLEKQRDILASTFAETLPKVLEELERVKQKQQLTSEAYQKLEQKLDANLKLLDLEQQKEAQLEKIEQAQAVLKIKIENQQNQISSSKRDLEEAQQAHEIVVANQASHDFYEQRQKELVQVEQQIRAKREVEQKATALELRLNSGKVELKGAQDRLVTDEAQLAKSLTTLKTGTEDEKVKLQHLSWVKEDLATWLTLGTAWQGGFREVASWLHTNRSKLDESRMERQSLEVLGRTMEQIATSLESLPELEKQLYALNSEDTLEGLQQQILAKQSELDALLRNEDHLTRGICPIILETCPSQRVSHGLDEFFKEQKESLEDQLRLLTQTEQEAKLVQAKKQEVQDQLRVGEQQSLALQKHQRDYDQVLQESFQSLGQLPWTELGQIRAHQVAVQQEYDQRRAALPEALKKWQLIIEGTVPLAPSVMDLPPDIPEQPTYESLGLFLNQLASWEAEINTKQNQWANYGQIWAQILQELEKQLGAKLAVAQGERERKNQELLELEIKQEQLQKEKIRLTEVETALAQETQVLSDLQQQLASFGELEMEQNELKTELEQHLPSYRLVQANLLLAQKCGPLQNRVVEMQRELADFMVQYEQDSLHKQRLLTTYSKEQHQALGKQVEDEKLTFLKLQRDLEELVSSKGNLEKQVLELQGRQARWEELGLELHLSEQAREYSKLFRQVLRDAADPIAQQYRDFVSVLATQIYRQVSSDNVRLEWGSQYELQLVDYDQDRERTRVFKQLSGGEQMTAALAVRLALMQLLSPLKIGFFDEPTTNLDRERRTSLALAIQTATADFDQLFLISHDDSFDAVTDNVIALRKELNLGSQLSEC